MQIKCYLHEKAKYNLNDTVRNYIREASIFYRNPNEIVNLNYQEIKDQCDDFSGDEGCGEIFSFDFPLSDEHFLELKLYYNRKTFFGDAIFIHGEGLDYSDFIKITKEENLKYDMYVYNDVDDEGLFVFENGVVSRFRVINEKNVIYQIECDFSLYPDFSNGIKKIINEKMRLI
ncbi:hypothetical protein [Serratia rubidaea]|uniref:Uncharacterized protein n=1 Tax=Serratia rubidaea TaxID=61652 RepID=A0A448SBU0_SERRU|nr:hypothetical protein [Serratia rubidaea]MBH1930181.1 hypothetical protein [Serratia rubidaea]MDC6117324.1 hypothetical protein [Serratia rubidaea]MEB7586341.1 hypothetical protein [Serratia rubidaea]VEI65133.1 Uncharacterised protein [Serratia rubidaea]